MSGPGVPSPQGFTNAYQYGNSPGADAGANASIGNLTNQNFALQNQGGVQSTLSNLFNGNWYDPSYAFNGAQTAGGLSQFLGNQAQGISTQANPAIGTAASSFGADSNQAGQTASGNSLLDYLKGVLGTGNQLGAAVAPTLAAGQGFLGQAGSIINQGQGIVGQGQDALNHASQVAGLLDPYAAQTLATGYDPQNALRDRTQQQLTDQTRATAAAQGVLSSPYAAGLENQANSNFDIDWQNTQLQRQQTAANTASTLYGSEAGLQNAATGIIGAGSGVIGAGTGVGNLGVNTLGAAQGLGQAQAGIGATGAQIGQGAQSILQGAPQGSLNALLASQGATNSTQQAGAGAAATLAGAATGASGAAQNLEADPTNTYFNAFTQANNAGAQANTNTQQQIADWLSYLSGGTSATNAQNYGASAYSNDALASEKQSNEQSQQFLKDLGQGIGDIFSLMP